MEVKGSEMGPQVQFKYQTPQEGIYVLTFQFSRPPFKIDQKFLELLERNIDEIKNRGDCRALILLSSHSQIFCEGTNFEEIALVSPKNAENKLKSGQAIFQKLTDFPAPVICAIRGICHGGGLELALACHYRLATEEKNTTFAFPEIEMGLMPGLGGTQRLPRLIGLDSALKLILTGKKISFQKARELGLVDDLYPGGLMKDSALHFTRNLLDKKKISNSSEKESPTEEEEKEEDLSSSNSSPVKEKREKHAAQVSWFRRYLLRRKYTKQLEMNQKPPVAFKILDTILSGSTLNLDHALFFEARSFNELLQNNQARNLIYVNLSAENLANHLPQNPFDLERPPLAVVGAGDMGTEIASYLAEYQIPVRLKDISQQTLGTALKRISNKLSETLDDTWELRKKEALISPTVLYRGMKLASAVVEAVIEDFEIKRRVLTELEEATHPETIIASTTSSFSISRLAEEAQYPERIVGLHFFYPLRELKVVEVIGGDKTSEETIDQIVYFIKSLNKIPIVIKDQPGFLIGRVALPYLNEALLLLEEGLLVEEIDRAMANFGMSMGPLAFIDLLGMDTLYYLANSAHETCRGFTPSAIIDKFYKNGRLGVKSGKGFYLYEKENQRRVDPKIYDLIKDIRQERKKLDEEIIIDRLLLPMIREAANCHKEEIAQSPLEMEIGLLLGLGFPPRRGGILHYANDRGMEEIVRTFKKFKKTLGERYEPGEVLTNYYQRKKQFLLT